MDLLLTLNHQGRIAFKRVKVLSKKCNIFINKRLTIFVLLILTLLTLLQESFYIDFRYKALIVMNKIKFNSKEGIAFKTHTIA